jgi:hypothetical protein
MADKNPYLVLKHRVPIVTMVENEEGKQKLNVFLFNHNKSGEKKINYNYIRQNIFTIDNFKPGISNAIYTWIIKSGNNFYAAKTREGQEIGTLHRNIADLTPGSNKISDIIAAGELKIEGNNLEYNLRSGTFMEPKYTKLIGKTPNEYTAELQDIFTSTLYGKGWNIKFVEGDPVIGGPLLNETNPMITANTDHIKELNKMFKRIPYPKAGGKRRTKRNRVKRRKTHKK